MRVLLFVICGIAFCNGINASNSQKKLIVLDSPFSISATKNIEVNWKGEKLINGDSHSWLGKEDVGFYSEKNELSNQNGWQITNVWSQKSPVPYRREIGISPDGRRIELNFQSHQDALMKNFPSSSIVYTIHVPLSALNNSKWEAFTGLSYNCKWSSGDLNSATPDGDIIGGPARWVSFATHKGKITFDFNPQGITTYYLAGANMIQSQWSLVKKGNILEVSFNIGATNYGGAMTSKLVIFEGDKNDYLKHHAVTYYHYFSEIPTERLYCFGGKSTRDFINAGLDEFNTAKGYGWKKKEGLLKSGGSLTGALYTAASSTKNNIFTVDNLRSGLYLITIRSSALNKNTGPYNVNLNGEKIFSNINVDKGKAANLTCVRWIEKGKADITFEGNWSVSVIGLQMFMHSDEDYEFRRGFWIKNNGYCPDVMFANYYNAPAVYGKCVTYSKLAGKVEEINQIPEMPELETALPDQNSNELSWRYTSPLGTMGPANWGSFNEFNTYSLLEQRLKEVKNGGTKAVILNGFLSRHTFPAHLPRVEENIRQTAEIAHKMGMKVFDHHDLTILWNMDMGFRFLAAHPEYLQHAQTNGMPNWGMCPVNPLFKDGYFFPFILNQIKNTNIDGLMIDECAFHGSNFCNCEYCREAFHKATGLVLPDDETSPLLRNRDSRLWKAWIEWRKNAIAQWRIDFSKAVHKINPSFCNIQYHSEGGFILDGASYEQGGDLALSAKSTDFLGTEIMSRDLWDDYRYTFSSRHMYNSLHETYNTPIFGLVYSGSNINNAIIGWAMNNMLAQVTWGLAFNGDEKLNDYNGWKENMNNFSAKPFADIAIVFSRKTRDWSLKNKRNYPAEIMGTSQFLIDHHIQHTFVLDDAFINQDLSRFRVLLAPGIDCLSDEQVTKIKQYVRNGGTLFISGDAGQLTSYGEPRSIWAFAGVFDNNTLNKAQNTDFIENNFGKGRIVYCAKRYGINDFCNSFSSGRIYQFTPDEKQTAIHGKIMRQVLGDKLSFETISMPSKVLTSVYNEFRDGENITMVHLLNATGVKVKNGDLLPLPDSNWEEIKEDMSFEISLPSISKAYYATPDHPGHKPIKIEQISDKRFKVTIPKETVEKYGIVYLCQ
jgi:hypothetical protein